MRTLSVVSAIFRTFPEIFLSYPHTVLKLWYKNRFVSRKPPHGGNKQGGSLVQYTCRSVRASNGSTDRRIRLGRIRIADRRILEPRRKARDRGGKGKRRLNRTIATSTHLRTQNVVRTQNIQKSIFGPPFFRMLIKTYQ